MRVVEAIGRGQRGQEGCQIDDSACQWEGSFASTVLCVELQTGI